MLPRLQHHLRGAHDGSRGEVLGDGSGKSREHAAVGHGLDDLVDVRGSRAGDSGDGVHLGFGHFVAFAHGAEEVAGGGDVLGGARGALGHGAREAPDEAWGVWHDAHDWDVRSGGILHGGEGHARRDGDDEDVRAEEWLHLAEEVGDRVGLDADEHHVHVLHHLLVAAADLASPRREQVPPGLVAIDYGHVDALGDARGVEAAAERLGHLARADESYPETHYIRFTRLVSVRFAREAPLASMGAAATVRAHQKSIDCQQITRDEIEIGK